MQLWQMDIVGGIRLVSTVTGELERATGRAVCLALAEALARFGVPDEVNTDIQDGLC